MEKHYSRMLIIVFGILILTSQAGAQVVKPTPTPDSDDVVKISTNLVQIDVSVTDSKGNPITDLRRDEIEIFENGKKQTLANFSFVSSARTATTETTAKVEDGISVPVPPPTTARPDQVRRTIVLMVDDLSLSFESAYHTRRAIRKFVNEQMEEGDLVAIVRSGGSIGALQQFTTDKRLLLAAADSIKWNPRSGRISGFTSISPGMKESLKAAGDTLITDAEVAAEQEARMAEGQPGLFVGELIQSLQHVVKGLSEMPGRKSIILFTDGFDPGGLARDPLGFVSPGDVDVHLSGLIESANRAAVVFYTLDSRGLQYTGPTAADDVKGTTNPQQYARIWSTRASQLFATQGGPYVLASKTGGLDFTNQNDLGRGIERALRDQSYYLIGYEPDSETFDPAKIKFNRFEVRVSRPGANVRYRSGFLGVEDRAIPERIETPQLSVEQALNEALISPFSKNDITLNLNPLYGYHPRTGNYVRSLLHVDVKDLRFTDMPDGRKKAEIAILAASYGMNGAVVAHVAKGFTLEIPIDALERLKTTGFVYQFTFPVKTPGSFQYRVALRDQQTGTVGSASQFIEIPSFKKDRPFISGILLQGYTSEEWSKAEKAVEPLGQLESDSKTDSSRRQFKVGSVVQYGFEIYNARPGTAKKPNVTTRIRLFRDGKLLMNGQTLPLDAAGMSDINRLIGGGAIRLTENMQPGEYILQIVVVDNLAKVKNQIATQFVQFEVLP